MMDNKEDVLKRALLLLSRREHTRFELQRKLLEKEGKPEEVELVLARLESEDLLSDARFAESFVRYRMQAGFGPNRIKLELSGRGVSQDLIAAYLSFEREDWEDSLRVLFDKRAALVSSDEAGRAKLFRYLTQRGFFSEWVYPLLNEVTE